MAAPTLLESNGSSFTFGGASSRTCVFSAAPSSDEIVILIYSATDISTGASSFSWGTGFTEFFAPDTTNSVQVAAAWKRAGGSESDTYTVNYTAGSGGNERLIGHRFSGCITSGSPIDDSNFQTFSFPGTTLDAGATTATVAETLHCIHLSSNGGTGSPTCTGYAETVYNQSFGGSNFAMDSRAFFDNDIVSSGAVADQTITHGGAGFFNVSALSFLLLPAGGGGGGSAAWRRRESKLIVPAATRTRYY